MQHAHEGAGKLRTVVVIVIVVVVVIILIGVGIGDQSASCRNRPHSDTASQTLWLVEVLGVVQLGVPFMNRKCQVLHAVKTFTSEISGRAKDHQCTAMPTLLACPSQTSERAVQDTHRPRAA